MITEFPPVELADEDGILCVGGDLEIDSLLLAYRSGIFPWPVSRQHPLVWFSPPERAVLFSKDFHVTRSLRKARERGRFEFTVNQDFPAVIRACAEAKNRNGAKGTWITEAMITAYIDLHEAGWAHSIETRSNGELVGGLYGVAIGKLFAGESMFFKVSNASKLALWFLIDYLRGHDVEWIDCQQLTPLFESFGAKEIPRKEFLRLSKIATGNPLRLFENL